MLLIESNLCSSLDPLFHSDSILNQVDAEEMAAFLYYYVSQIAKTKSVLGPITYSMDLTEPVHVRYGRI